MKIMLYSGKTRPPIIFFFFIASYTFINFLTGYFFTSQVSNQNFFVQLGIALEDDVSVFGSSGRSVVINKDRTSGFSVYYWVYIKGFLFNHNFRFNYRCSQKSVGRLPPKGSWIRKAYSFD